MLKKTQVVMLPTNEKAEDCLAIYYNGKMSIAKGLLTQSYLKEARIKTFHLYFLSDEKIKEGDWALHPINISIPTYCFGTETYSPFKLKEYGYKKIIASTQAEFIFTSNSYGSGRLVLPQPSQSFLEVFVREYNKRNKIESVLVEYEELEVPNCTFGLHGNYEPNVEEVLKINPKDNTITIKRVKDSWSREEVIQILIDYTEDKLFVKNNKANELIINQVNKWIEQNL